MQATRPVIIGLAGGVASGKSTVAREFAKHGAEVIDADEYGHLALKQPELRGHIVAAFGTGVLGSAGEIDRVKLGQAVFGDAARLKALADITHPWIRAEIRKRLDALKRQQGLKAVVLDISLLLESGAYEDDLDAVVFVDVPEAERERRAQASRGWRTGEVARRQSHQMPLDRKRARADAVVNNGVPLNELAAQVADLWKQFVDFRESR